MILVSFKHFQNQGVVTITSIFVDSGVLVELISGVYPPFARHTLTWDSTKSHTHFEAKEKLLVIQKLIRYQIIKLTYKNCNLTLRQTEIFCSM